METHVAGEGRSASSGERMVRELQGVPKTALQTVFGKALGQRIWLQARRTPPLPAETAPVSGAGPHLTPFGPSDGEIVQGMIGYLSRRAGETLRLEQRQAKTIGLRLVYADGAARMYRLRLARPSSDAREIAAAASELFQRCERRADAPLESIDLTASSVQAEAVRDEEAAPLDCVLAGSQAWT
jgi:nucleotidyltransferase/DNA polymerase involved in DNA repair